MALNPCRLLAIENKEFINLKEIFDEIKTKKRD